LKLTEPKNKNYAAIIVKIPALFPLDGLDNLIGVPMFGAQAIVPKTTQVGDLAVWFPAEVQLSQAYAAANNLYRHAEFNADTAEKGYLEDNRRVKALRLRGHQSDSLLMPLSSLAFTGIDLDGLNVGDTFDEIGGMEICRKYLIKEPGEPRINKNAKKKFTRVESRFLPEHYDTDNYWRNAHVIPENAEIVVTQKLHGTSIRIGHTVVARELSWLERLAKRLGIRVADSEYDHVYGSRKVIKDANNPNQDHFYGHDLWSLVGKRYDAVIPENFIVYGEVIGWSSPDSPIQKNYTYGIPTGENELYVYRVALVTNQGRIVDLGWDQVKNFCVESGLMHVPELWRGKHSELVIEDFIDMQLRDIHADAIPLHQGKKYVDEGVCIRTDAGTAPYILKAKSPIFLQHETKMLDQDILDLETVGSDTEGAL